MNQSVAVESVLVDDQALSIEDVARVCRVEVSWVVERVESGLLGGFAREPRTQWRFASAEVVRARRLVAFERDMDANPELAALVVDLIEEVHEWRRRAATMR